MTCGYSYGASFFETVESTISNTTELIAVPRPRPVIRVYSFEAKPEMKNTHSRQLVRSGAGALLLLMLQWLCASPSAWASCGHLVTSRSERLLDLNRLDGVVVSGSDRVPDEPPLPGSQAPCSGLSCSSRDPLPVSTATVGYGGPSEQCATLMPLMTFTSKSRPRSTRTSCRRQASRPRFFIPLAFDRVAGRLHR